MEVVVHEQGATMFSDEELKGIANIKRRPNHIEVECLLKSTRHGEPSGKLKIFPHGKLEIKCECSCHEDKLSPRSFLKHYNRNHSSNWKNQIYINTEKNKRIPLQKTHLLKYYYRDRPQEVKVTLRPRQAVHRDEFIRCSRCRKERRFRLRTAEEHRAYHNAALAKLNWTCSDIPHDKLTCEDPEERQSRKVRRGCPESDRCSGCMSCVCVGCGICRFKGCPCRTCADYINNVAQ